LKNQNDTHNHVQRNREDSRKSSESERVRKKKEKPNCRETKREEENIHTESPNLYCLIQDLSNENSKQTNNSRKFNRK
jgi:hypothetical protein